jgi:sugar phosphate isomerase/epimerase
VTTLAISTAIFGTTRPGPREWESLISNGFTEIELTFATSEALGEAAAAGIKLSSLSVALTDGQAGVALAAEAGCKLLVVRASPCRLHASDPRLAPESHALRRIIEPLASGARTHGVTLALEFPASWPSHEAVAFLESLDSPPVGVCLDLGHAHMHEGAPESIEQLAGYVHTIHLHDNLGRADDHRLPFAGSIDWPSVLMELEKTGYLGPLVLEVPGEPDVATAVARAVGARTRLQAILDDLAQPMVFPE